MFPFLIGVLGIPGFILKTFGVDITGSATQTPQTGGSLGTWDDPVPDAFFKMVTESEGFDNPAKHYGNEPTATIGHGTCYYYNEDGTPFKTHHICKVGDTLFGMKKLMGYGSLSDADFAYKLMQNEMKSPITPAGYFLRMMKQGNYPYIPRLKEAFKDWSYTTGSMLKTSDFSDLRQAFLNAIKTKDVLLITKTYAFWRYKYYRALPNWSGNKLGWMRRVFRMSYYMETGQIMSKDSIDSRSASWLSQQFQARYGFVINW